MRLCLRAAAYEEKRFTVTFLPRRRVLFALLLSVSFCAGYPVSPAYAQEEAEEAAGQDRGRPIYIPLKPPFVVNYGGKGRLRYLRAELSVRVGNISAANSIRHHMPFIRNNLVLLFSRQKEEDIDTQEGKEMLRLAALEEIRSIVEAEDGGEGIIDLYFNNFVIQK